MKSKGSDFWDKLFSDVTAKTVFIVSIFYAIGIACTGWNNRLSDLYAFRQTQTAISARYLLRGGPWFAYETPISGPPWSIPFEFPLYQWIVALIAKSGLFALDQAGRFGSELFFFLSLYPLFKILGFLKLSKRQRYLILAIFCISPEYLFWSRSFMIESTALALSLYFLWLVFVCCEQAACNRTNGFALAGVALTGALAGMVKITTFFSFMVGACMVIAIFTGKKYREKGLSKNMLITLCPIIISSIIVPFLASIAWTRYADSLKVLNPMVGASMSNHLEWVFGTFKQRISMETWRQFYSATLKDLIGSSFLAVLSVAAIIFCRKERAMLALASLFLFVLTLFTFVNLHYVHSYYAYANGIFFIVGVGIIITELLESNDYAKRITGGILFCLIIIFSSSYFFKVYLPKQKDHFDFSPITTAVNTYSNDNDIFVIFGNRGSSEIPYYINRRAVNINDNSTLPDLMELKKRLNGYRLGGLIFYSRGGFDENIGEYINGVTAVFGVKPVYSSYYTWYKGGSDFYIVFNGAR